MCIRDSYGSYYYDGLQVWDVRDPQNISRVLHFSTSNIPHRPTFEGAWGVYPFLPSGVILVSDMQEGLFVIESVENTVATHDQALEAEWNIYPNPSLGNFNISIEPDLKLDEIQLLNIEGKLIQDLDLSNNLNLTPGTYKVKISNGEGTATKSLIIAQ